MAARAGGSTPAWLAQYNTAEYSGTVAAESIRPYSMMLEYSYIAECINIQ